MTRFPAVGVGDGVTEIAQKDRTETFAESDVSLSHTDTQVLSESIMLKSLILDDAEDGDISVKSPEWSGWTGDTANLSSQTGTVLSGSRSLELNTTSGRNLVTAAKDNPEQKGYVSFLIEIDHSPESTGDDVDINIEGDTSIATALFRYTGDIQISNTADGTWTAGTTYKVEFWLDWTNEVVDGVVTRVSDGTEITNVQNEPFYNSNSTLNEIQLEIDTSGPERNLYVDDLLVAESESDPPLSGTTYVEWPEPADVYRWDAATFQRTEDGETVSVYIEESTDGGDTWTEIAGPISRGQDITADPASEVRFRVELSRSDTANSPSLDAIYRRWVV